MKLNMIGNGKKVFGVQVANALHCFIENRLVEMRCLFVCSDNRVRLVRRNWLFLNLLSFLFHKGLRRNWRRRWSVCSSNSSSALLRVPCSDTSQRCLSPMNVGRS